MVWRIASADLVQMNGFGSSLWAWMKAVMAAFSSCTLRCTPRLICLSASSACNLVEPGGAGRREMKVIARVAGEPGFDGRRFVGSVIVEHQVDVEIGRHGLFDRGQELSKFDRTMALVAAADDLARGDVEGGEQRGRAVALVVVSTPLGLPRSHRQQRLRAIERLDLRLFIDTQDQGTVGRVEVEPDNVAHLVDKQRIAGQLEGL